MEQSSIFGRHGGDRPWEAPSVANVRATDVDEEVEANHSDMQYIDAIRR